MILVTSSLIDWQCCSACGLCVRVSSESVRVGLTCPTCSPHAAPCFRVCPESVRWLLTQGRTQEAERLIRKIAETNGTTVSPHLLADYDSGAADQEDGAARPPSPLQPEPDTEVRRRRPAADGGRSQSRDGQGDIGHVAHVEPLTTCFRRCSQFRPLLSQSALSVTGR